MRVVVLTGAGISAESGVPTFRDADGLWEGHRVEDVATPQAFRRDPETVHRFYDARRAALASVEPNPAHEALAALERALGDDLLLVTQNIDDLHERGGSTDVLHMHGRLRSALCAACDARVGWDGPLLGAPPCAACGADALRPDVVWFGEVPLGMERIQRAVARCEVFCSIGTSGAVYPAAGFVQYAAAYGAHTVELNLVPSEGTAHFAEARHGPASRLVPAWVAEITTG
ncbi:NAD-dependent deacylase [Nocardioides sp. CFH 31398]|uniref:NAD-dependent deacylase n=1 Tax=Nocardioides sp. CFH 31398 TaxID=2919579 RepID=UPI001F0636E0|nr:NAD-dependent deacylase [Nocardioides sp. CFH 31398]MCH1865414.1 NAD-dependent deacylase [Nocardioides sp. CFH 31398]